jgi:hypothetical protein
MMWHREVRHALLLVQVTQVALLKLIWHRLKAVALKHFLLSAEAVAAGVGAIRVLVEAVAVK